MPTNDKTPAPPPAPLPINHGTRRLKTKLLASASEQAGLAEPKAKPTAPLRLAWPINEAAYRLGVSRVTIYDLAKRNKLALIKIAGRTLVPETEIVRLTTPVTVTEAA